MYERETLKKYNGTKKDFGCVSGLAHGQHGL